MSPPLRFGCLLMPRSLERTRAAAALAEAAGFDWFGVGDSPALFEDAFLHLAEAARVTTDIALGPMATHVVIRHPLVVANQLATLSALSGGRVAGVVATGNSAARGLGLPPATLARLEEAIGLMRSYWAGRGGRYEASTVPASGIERAPVPLFVAGDGPRTVTLAGRVGDGILYSGSLAPEVLGRRVAAAAPGTRPPAVPPPWSARQELWVAAASSLAPDLPGAREELGAVLVAIANRAMRGDLAERGVPERLHADVAAMWAGYDYAAHGTFERPRNVGAVSVDLADHLLADLCLVGDEERWAATLERLRCAGVGGFVVIVNQADEVGTLRRVAERLRALGLLEARA